MGKQDRKDREKERQARGSAARGTGRLAEYFWANLIFWAFIGALSLFTWESCQSPSDSEAVRYVLSDTFRFILLLFGAGFTLVTLFDWAYDFFASRAEETKPAEGKAPLP